MINLQDAESRVAATGEYVLGTLSEEEQAAFHEALARDPALRAEVYRWQDQLLSLSAQAAPVAPRAQLWQRIDTTLSAMAAAKPRAAQAAPVAPSAQLWQRIDTTLSAMAAAKPRAAQVQSMGRGPSPWWQRLGLWQGLSGLALAACLAMVVVLVDERGNLVPGHQTMGARYLAVLQSPKDQRTGWLVEVQAGGTVRLLPMGDTGAVPAGRALQFWTKPQGAAGPTSLGLVRAGHPLELPVSRLPGVGAQQLFEITLEPEQGSPIDRPTGPILYVGRTIAL